MQFVACTTITRRWLELESGAVLPAAVPVAMVEAVSDAVMNRIGGVVKSVVHRQLGDAIVEVLPGLIHGALAKQQTMIREGETAGQIWKRFKLPTKGMHGYAFLFWKKLAGGTADT